MIAEQVEKVNPDLVVRDEDGKANTVRYEAVNAMLLNEFLKAHRKLDQQQAMIDRAAEANRSPHCDCSEGERSGRPRQTWTTVSRQPLNSFVAYRI